MFETLATLLTESLKFLNAKDAEKYIDKKTDLEKQYYEESNKPEGERDNNVLDRLHFELRLLSDSTATQLRIQNAANK